VYPFVELPSKWITSYGGGDAVMVGFDVMALAEDGRIRRARVPRQGPVS
jgi:hypothetical protein